MIYILRRYWQGYSVARRLLHGERSSRYRAANELRTLATALPPALIVPPLVAALKDQDSYVADCAEAALASIRSERAVGRLVRLLPIGQGGARAARLLGILGDRRAIEPLLKALGTDDRVTDAAAALVRFKEDRVVKAVLQALVAGRCHPLAVPEIVRGLSSAGEADALVPWLLQELGVPNYSRTEAALKALSELGRPETIEPVVQFLNAHPDHKAATQALIEWSGPEVGQLVEAELRTRLPELEWQRAAVLGKILSGHQGEETGRRLYAALAQRQTDAVCRFGASVVEHVMPLLASRFAHWRCLAVEVIGRFPEAGRLNELLELDDAAVRDQVGAALDRCLSSQHVNRAIAGLSPENATRAIELLRPRLSKLNTAAGAVQALARLGSDGLAVLTASLAVARLGRHHAMTALASAGETRAAPVLACIMRGEEGRMATVAASAIANFDRYQASRELAWISSHQLSLDDPSRSELIGAYEERRRAARALMQLGWTANTTEDEIRMAVFNHDWNAVLTFGGAAVPFILPELEVHNGGPVVKTLLDLTTTILRSAASTVDARSLRALSNLNLRVVEYDHFFETSTIETTVPVWGARVTPAPGFTHADLRAPGQRTVTETMLRPVTKEKWRPVDCQEVRSLASTEIGRRTPNHP